MKFSGNLGLRNNHRIVRAEATYSLTSELKGSVWSRYPNATSGPWTFFKS